MAETPRTVVLDANWPWVRSLFEAMPDPERVRLVRVENPRERLGRSRTKSAGTPASSRIHSVLVPGLRRLPRVSQRLVANTVRRLATAEPIDVLVGTNPWHAPAFEATPAAFKVYFVTDPFEFYAWPPDQTAQLEQRMIETCDLIVAVSLQLVDDFRGRTGVPVVHLPNAVSRSFVEELEGDQPTPSVLAGLDQPVVGAVGRINDTYDWQLVADLSRQLPDVAFVLVGPAMQTEIAEWHRFQELVDRPNVHWVGEQPHEQLPQFLSMFDLCLNPLKKDPRNDRRCPLRLFDYAATRAPILSTPTREVEYFDGHVKVFEDAEAGTMLIRELLNAPAAEPTGRGEWVRQNTWNVRAEEWLGFVEAYSR